MRRAWVEAEELGVDCLFNWDHFFPLSGEAGGKHFEALTVLGAMAEVTERVELGSLVICNSYRNPDYLADATRTIDHISGGRAILGLGAAWNEEESDAYDIPFPSLKERFERLEDALNIARLMFTRPEATYEGKHHKVAGALNNPKPLRGDIPILVGGSGERKTLRMVAQYADACNIFGDVDRVKHLLGVLERHCEEVGRDPAEITKTRNSSFIAGRTSEEVQRKLQTLREAGVPEERLGPSLAIIGTPDELAARAQEFKDAGLDGLTGSIPDVHDLEAVQIVGEAIGPVFA
jgi:F420-dependent oxidoreductase-like protein